MRRTAAAVEKLSVEIKRIEQANFGQVAEIYKEGIETGFATFQNDIPDWESWDKSHLPNCRIAAFEAGKMAGWAALTPVSSRCVYAGVGEVAFMSRQIFAGAESANFY